MNQAIFEKIYISCNKEVPLEIEEEYRPPFNSIIAPVKEDLTKLNRSLKLNTEVALVKIATSKNRILNQIRCGLSSCNEYTDIESSSKNIPKNFRDIFSSKGLLVEMTGIEPVSESIFTGISPSAVSDLRFALLTVRKRTAGRTIPLVPYAAGRTHKVFLHV